MLLLIELPSPELILVLLLRLVTPPLRKLGLDGKGMDSRIPFGQKHSRFAALILLNDSLGISILVGERVKHKYNTGVIPKHVIAKK